MLIIGVLKLARNYFKKIAITFLCNFIFCAAYSIFPLHPGSIGSDQTICSAETPNPLTSISPAISGNGTYIYQWQQSTTSISSGFTNISGANALTYSPGALTQTTYFRRTVSTLNDPEVYTDAITVIVNPNSVGGTIYRSRNSCRGTDLTIFTLVGHVGNIIRWESSPSNLNPVWTPIINTTNELTLSSFATTTYYRAVVQNGTCPVAFSTINFTAVNPSISNGWVTSPPPGIVCGGTNSFVFTLVAFTGSVLHWESSPSPSFNTPTIIPNTANLTQYTATNLITTMYYRAVTSTGNCAQINSVAEGKETLPPSIGGTIVGSDTICSNTNSTLLTLSGQSGSILRWESSSDINFTSINTISNTTTTYTATNVANTTYYRAVVKRGSCPEAYSSTAVITIINSSAVGGTFIGGGTWCTSASSIQLSLNSFNGTLLSWQSSDDSTFTTNVTTISTTNNPLSVGRPLPFVRYYRALVDVPGCGSVFSTFVKIIVVDQTVAGASAGSTTFCSTTNSHNITLSGNLGSVLRWESSTNSNFIPLTNINNTTTTLALTNINTTTYYRAVVRNDSCDTRTSTSSIVTILTSPDAGTLTGSDTICNSSNINSTTLVLNNFVGSISKWQSSSNSNFTTNVTDIVNTNDSLIITNLSTTTYYRVIVTNGTCPADTSNIAVIMLNPISNGGNLTGNNPFNPNIVVCSGINSSTLILRAHVGTILKWQSSTSSDFSGVVTDITNTTSSYIATNLTSTTYYRVIVKSGICEADTSNIRVITVNPVTDAGILNNDTVCGTNNSTTIRLSNYIGSIIKWESSTVANFSSGITTIANTTDSLVITNLSTTTFYRVIVKSGVCSADTSNIANIVVSPASVGGAITGGGGVCTTNDSITLLLSGYTGSIIKWQSSTSPTFSNSITDIANTTNTYIATNISTATYYRAVIKNGNCDSTFSTVHAITIDTKPVAGSITGTDTVCAGINSNTLHLINYTGNIVHWQSSNSQDFSTNLQTIANTSDSLIVNNLLATTFYRVIVSNGVCDPDTSLIAIIKVDSNSTAAEILTNDTLCINQNFKTLKLINFFGSVLYWQSSADSNFISNLQTINNTTDSLVVNNLNTSTYYRALIKNGTCSIDTSKFVFLKIDELPIAGLLSNSDSFCLSNIAINTILRLNSYFGTIIKWQSSTSPDFSTNVSDINNNTDSLLISNITQTIYYRVVVSNGVCNNDTSNIAQLFIHAPSDAGNLTGNNPFNPNIIVCAGSNSSTLILSSYIGSIIKWQSAADSNFIINITDINNTSNSLLVTNISSTTYYRVIVQSADCEPDTSNFKVIIVNQPSVAGQILSDTICINGSTILRLENYLGSILEWQSSSSADFSTNLQTIANTTDSLVINNLSATTYYRVIVKNGVCDADTSLIAFVKVVSNSYSNNIISPQPDSFIISGNPNTIIGSINSIDSNFISYQWQYTVTTDSTLFININNSDSINHNPNTITQTTWYRRIIYNSICNSYDTSNIIRLTVTYIDTNININARLGLALNVANPINLSEGSYQIDYRITIKNYGNTVLEKIKLKENLSDVFPAPSAFTILNIQSSTGLILDPNFDGVNQLFLLDSTQNILAIGATHTIDIRLQVQTNLSNVIYYNQVTAIANAINTSVTAIDTSVDGLNPDPNNDSIPDEQSPTIVEILVFVPSGFSPNGDGKNDEFKIRGIENYPNNKLEIYNRWGNLVFEQAPYDNTWRGDVKNSNAYIIGDGILPSGTYFYLLDFGVPGSKQLSGYIVIRK